ncbi:MAG: potassium channel family protein [Pseudomonadota bacterium]
MELFAIMLSAALALLTIVFHSEVLLLIERISLRTRSKRKRLILIWISLLTAHAIEIWLYAGAFWAGDQLGLGDLNSDGTLVDYVYFSAMVFTTVGFGDIIPTGELRMLAGTEALTGLCLIAWSATATYAHWSDAAHQQPS